MELGSILLNARINMLTIEMKLLGMWLLMWIAFAVHHFMVRDMIKHELKKFKEKTKE